ncbi:MAG: hypothetical protein P9X24_11125 [Candidatus Hatepunaea meridiana]|nr:hypothetical protein [Candidatus Hatepunaea meridiana]
MNRFIGCILIILLIVSSTAFATVTRVTTMGNVGQIIKDRSNVGTYPQVIVEYSDMMGVEINGAGVLTAASAWYSGIGPGKLGLTFSTGTLANSYAPAIDSTGRNYTVYHQKIGLIYGLDIGEMLLGVQLNMFGNSHERDFKAVPQATPPVVKDKSVESVSGFGLRFGATLMENIEAYFNFQNVSWKHEGADGKMLTEPNGNMVIGFGGRYWFEMRDNCTLVPYFNFTMSSEGAKDAADNEIKNFKNTINLGVGRNSFIAENAMVVTDIGIQLQPFKTEVSVPGLPTVESRTAFTSLPYFRIGLEAELTSWMDIRLGAHKDWQKKSTENNLGDNEYWSWANTTLFLGAGFHFKNLDIDAAINPRFLTSGPFILSGTSNALTFGISMIYTWGE